MDTLKKLCTEKKRNGALEADVKRLTQQLADVRAAQEKAVIERQATKDALAAKEAAEKQALALAEELKGVKTTHAQALLACNAQVDSLRVQIINAQKRAEDAKYERDGARARLQQLQNSQQRYQKAMSQVQHEITTLGAELVRDRKYLVNRLEHSNDQMFTGLVKKLIEAGRQAKVNIYEESAKTVGVYADGWQSRLKTLSKDVTDSVVTTGVAVQAPTNVPPALAPESRAGSSHQNNAGENFQFDSKPGSPGADPGPA